MQVDAISRAGMGALLLAAAVLAQQKNPFGMQPDAVARGRETYLGACSACHGITGQGGQGPNLVSGRRVSRMSDAQLFGSIKNGVRGTDMPPFPLPDENVWRLVSFLRSMSVPAIRANLGGSAESGRGLFYGKAGCAGCHAIGGRGGSLGPDLTNAGAARTASELRESLVEPSARIVRGFEAITVFTASGAEVRGVARNRDNYSIQLLDRAGKLHLFHRGDWRDVKEGAGSLMPGDYASRLGKSELDDLLAFLARQSIRKEPL
ncbi:MAG: c-type cytochrome [Bryobacteraceae bacterium]